MAVNLPQGFVLDEQPQGLPEGFVLDSSAPTQPAPEPETFVSRLQKDFDRRRAAIDRVETRMGLWQPYTQPAKPGEYRGQGLTPISGALQQVGQYVGGGFDILGEGATSLYNAIPESVKDTVVGRAIGQTATTNLVPGLEAVTGIKTSPAAIASTVGSGVEAAREYAPDAVANIEAAANIIPVAQAAVRGVGAVGTLGKSIESSGISSAEKQAFNKARDIVSPKATAATKASQERIETGWNKRQEIVDPYLDEMAATVQPYIKKSDSLLGNENAINKAIVSEAEKLKASLMESNAVISDDTIFKGLQAAQENLNKLAWIQEGGKNSAQKVIEIAQGIIDSKPRTPAGMLEARIELDQVIKRQMPNVFDAVRDAPIKAAVQEVRNFMNSAVADAVPDVGVRESLRKQNLMYNAVDNIAPKRAALPETRVGRAAKKVQDAVSLKSAVLAAGAAGGIGLGAAPVILPAAGLYAAGKVAASPATRKIIGQALQVPENVLQTPSRLAQRLTKADLQAAFEARKAAATPEAEITAPPVLALPFRDVVELPASKTTVFVDKNGVGVPLTKAEREIIGQMPSEFLNPTIEEVSKLPQNEARDLLDKYLRSVSKGKSPR